MSFAHTDPADGAPAHEAPELPDGWHYTDDLVWDEAPGRLGRRPVVALVAVTLAALALILGLAVVNAQVHYSRGLTAFAARDYGRAAGEFAGATLYVIPYRDAALREAVARREAFVRDAGQQEAADRLERVQAAVAQAAATIKSGRLPAALAALSAVDAADLRRVAADDQDVQTQVQALAHDVSADAGKALREYRWGRAERLAAVLALLDPRSQASGDLAARAAAGRELSAKLARAQDAAQHKEWRKALRLALAVSAQHDGFPGAASVIARARLALKPKPAPRAATTSPSSASTGSTGGTSSGASSGSSGSSQPPPP